VHNSHSKPGGGKKKGKNPRNDDPLEQETEIIEEQAQRRRDRRKTDREVDETGIEPDPNKTKPPIDSTGKSRSDAKKDLERQRRELNEDD
jgi:hypothetical protein